MSDPRYKSRKQYPDSGDAGTGEGWDQWNEIIDQENGKVVLAAINDSQVIVLTEALNKGVRGWTRGRA